MTASAAKVLVVDDTDTNIKLLRALLRGAGYDVVTATCGTDANCSRPTEFINCTSTI